MQNKTTFAAEIRRAHALALEIDKSSIATGLGIDDPKGIFGTTLDLHKEFGCDRVFDMPTAENGMTGVGIGAAITGTRVVMTHQRLDFFLLAMDQLVNNAAKWHYMFNGTMKVPLTIRLILGRGWGQGPTHAQNLQTWFAHIPGLKVVVPSTASTVASQLYNSIMDDNPVVFLEHRWLHNQQVNVQDTIETDKLVTTRLARSGKDITIVANSYMLIEAMRAAEFLGEHGIEAEIIELCQVNPIDWQLIEESVTKTGRLLAVDAGALTCSLSSEIVAHITQTCFAQLKVAPQRLAMPDIPEPTSHALTKDFYNQAEDISMAAGKMFGLEWEVKKPSNQHDVPGEWFKGPF